MNLDPTGKPFLAEGKRKSEHPRLDVKKFLQEVSESTLWKSFHREFAVKCCWKIYNKTHWVITLN